MTWDQFQKRATKIHLQPPMVNELERRNLVKDLPENFTEREVRALLEIDRNLDRQGYTNRMVTQSGAQPIIIYLPTEMSNDDSDEDENNHEWVVPFSIILIIITLLTVVLWHRDPNLFISIQNLLKSLGG
ncbi:TPA: hypothetical protein DIU27_01560 [Candidatus Collierbacteria bacterium]|uniref:Uncharacterized protein n=1 Tax=Candidatus Collierbacteria bacterium GW2011_GWB2_44_22 TaxID=1618387 RepID=A0A0G1KV62_9BACT|nr:MAG: hypothetical protein UW31_C0021G0002 [Candidatus Collierbacteria bacterium GW2011_GWA2_44_13]KKT51789.1 MAG: hypothetical protein UW44_C0008G0111 [Candidatus Collierbacteria bacterium GW2011_GWB2_44_22]KKT61914.1 MAG: hypothetical protein UW56_C0015G0008 [Candidatus Collierbacteria bacterium GW2011_GWD1_44_27]KKT65798.1 MAG: hypothetical protein UW58_C0019G0018 [Candidatus Collierbacteria bacterium GW2011_GWC2_44_30]KKT68468.1 MAG: hypothetical protein UW64_C0018G0016 [Microgenomates gr